MKNVVIFPIILLLFNTALSQSSANFYNTSRFARPIGMGNSFIGVSEGVETTFYNSAGLAFMDNYGIAYSYGNGIQPLVESKPFDIGLTFPNFGNIGSLAFSAHFLNFDELEETSSIYRLHYSRLIINNVSIGTSINYYNQKYGITKLNQDNKSDAFDISISGLFVVDNLIFSNDQDIFKIGFQFNNIFSSKIDEVLREGNFLLQYFGIGMSYKYILPVNKYHGFAPLSILFASDFVFDNSLNYDKYKFDRMNINFGFEFKIFELLALRFGRENDKNLSDINYTTVQFPVSRFGIGFDFPIHKFINLENNISIFFDFAFSKWQKQDEINRLSNKLIPFSLRGKSDKYSFSIQVQATI